MEEAAFCGVVVAGVMLGVPLWHSIGECRRGRTVSVHLLRWWLTCAVMLLLCLLLAILCGISIVLLCNLPPPKMPPVFTSCKILAKGVYLRSAKVCESDHSSDMLSNIAAHTGRSKFRCYFDYYWTSVFKVEFRPHASEAAIEAAAEAPGEALPLHCRPGFGAVWRAKEEFQINEEYPCKYSPENLLWVELTDKIAGNCTVNEPLKSNTFLHQFRKVLANESKIFLSSSESGRAFWRTVVSVSLGFCYSIFVTGVTKTACCLRFGVFETEGFSNMDVLYFEARLQASFLFVACTVTLVWRGSDYEEQIGTAVQHFIAAVERIIT